MSTFLLDKKTYARIAKELPDTDSAQKKVLVLEPYFISMQFSHSSVIPIASVCLRDAAQALQESRYGLREALAHQILYEEKENPPNMGTSIFFRRYYYNDVAFRLYSAGEDLANAIIFMLEIDESTIERYREKHTSLQSVVGNFLRTEHLDHPITKSLIKLIQAKRWQDAIIYRNECIHDQPPTVKGFGVIYHRAIKWSISKDGKGRKLHFGKKEKAKYSIDEIFDFIKGSLFLFTETFNEITDYYIKILQDKGLNFDFKSGKFSFSINFT